MKRVLALLLTAILSLSSLVYVSAADSMPKYLTDNYEITQIPFYNSFSNFTISEGLVQFNDSEKAADGKMLFGFKDLQGNVVIPAKFYNVGNFHNGLAAAALYGSSWGYINIKGDFVIPPVFSNANDFDNGYAVVNVDGKSQIINTKGEAMLPKNCDFVSDLYFEDLKYAATDGSKTDIYDINMKRVKTLYIKNLSIVKIADKPLVFYYNDLNQAGAKEFDSGKTLIKPGDFYVYTDGKHIITEAHESLEKNYYDENGVLLFTTTGYGAVGLSKNSYFVYDQEKQKTTLYTGSEVKEFDYMIYSSGITTKQGLLYRTEQYSNESVYNGLVDSSGAYVIPPKYSWINDIHEEDNGTGDLVSLFAVGEDFIDIYDENAKLVKSISNAYDLQFGSFLCYKDKNGSLVELDMTGKTLFTYDSPRFSDFYSYYGYRVFKFNGLSYAAFKKGTVVEPQLVTRPIKELAWISKNQTQLSVYLKAGDHRAFIGGKAVCFDEYNHEITPLIENNRLYGTAEFLSYIFKSGIETREYYNANSSGSVLGVEVSYRDKRFLLMDGEKTATLSTFNYSKNAYDEKLIQLDAPTFKKEINQEVRRFIPLRLIVEEFGFGIDYKNGISFISTNLKLMTDANAKLYNTKYASTMFTRAEVKRLDASLATQPFVDYVMPKFLGITEAENAARYTNTIPAYEALIDGTKDVILVTEPSKEMLELAKKKGVTLEVTPFAKEGFVFLNNMQNKVENATVDHLRDIYSGKLTNWSSLGGDNLEIIPYQRNESSGSQTIMENVFMAGYELMEPVMENRVTSMGGLIESVAEFKENSGAGLGYSVYYYAANMYSDKNVRLMSVNGVKPSSKSIEDGSYPLIVNYYIVTRKGDNSELTKRFKNFFLSQDGQKDVKGSGLVPVN